MEEKIRIVDQLVDHTGKYRSLIMVYGEPLEFVSKDRKEAIIYSPAELSKALLYYEHNNITVEISRTYFVESEEI
jgi:hypothetical protein